MSRRNQSRFQAFISSPFTLVIVVIVFVLVARAAWNIRIKAIETADRLDAARADLASIEADRQEVASRVERLSTAAGIRAEVRDKYHAVEPGESVVVIVDPAPNRNSSTTTATASSTDARRGFWSRFLGIFSRD